jgi:hypothetical protein
MREGPLPQFNNDGVKIVQQDEHLALKQTHEVAWYCIQHQLMEEV